jgi:hypothetical protein
MVSINDNSSTEKEQNNLNIYDILNLEPLSALDKFNLAIVKSNSILDNNILPLSVAALTMENENATIDEIAMWLAAKRKDKRDHPEYEANLIRTRKLLDLQ